MINTQAERTVALETEVLYMRREIAELDRKLEVSDKKLDDLLALRNKGVGVFWLASLIFGASIAGAASLFISWIKGHVV